jgi:hypothetical protein
LIRNFLVGWAASFVTCRAGSAKRIVLGTKMARLAQPHTVARAPRVKLAGTVLTLLVLENGRQLRADLHQLSTTGGLLHLDQPLDEGIKVELAFHVGKNTVRSKARVLFPIWATHGCLQPFEFDGLSQEDVRKLELNVQELLQSSSSPASPQTCT